ncbi:hypothetical protein M3182_03125 [Mesobacillus maritimus]|uniref:hypothetical protein n=1 Tax=Mesobacillus maritimus TaxID=1643336 RepID=UPI00203DEEA6|nr:hypothetical protein [Mesobacillus maritimus]MCM3584737.1 hypothetical protein [Mesobacillus maritimus]MCM3671346.1 hypothetical protein [Mesobacillus maritimus]
MQTKVQTSQNMEIKTTIEPNTRKFFNLIGLFIFAGWALTSVTAPLPSSTYTKDFLLFVGVSAAIYFFLVNIYFIGGLARKVFYASLILLSILSLSTAVYLATNSVPH